MLYTMQFLMESEEKLFMQLSQFIISSWFALLVLSPLFFGGDYAVMRWVLSVGMLVIAGGVWMRHRKLRLPSGGWSVVLAGRMYLLAVLWAVVQPYFTGQQLKLIEVMDLLGAGACFYCAAMLCRDEARARQMLWCVVLASLVVSAYGLVNYAAGLERVLWLDKVHYINALTATFISRNSAAIYFSVALLSGVVLLKRSVLKGAGDKHGGELLWYAARQFSVNNLLLILCLGVIAVALLLTFSRSGLLALGVGGACLLMMFLMQRQFGFKFRLVGIIVVVVVLVCAGAVCLQSMQKKAAHWDSLQDTSLDRYTLYKTAINVIAWQPWAGYGLGNFEESYYPFSSQMQRKIAKNRHDRLDKAHNTYLQMAVELGVPAAMLLVMACVVVSVRCAYGVRHRKYYGMYPALGVGVSMMLGVNALLDFSVEIPAVAYHYAALLGVGWVQSFQRNEWSMEPLHSAEEI
jgi:O-antigen ligase